MRALVRQEPSLTFERLTGSQKAAIVLLSIGDAAASVMKWMSPAEIESMTLEIARLEFVSNEIVERVLAEMTERQGQRCLAGGIDSARQVAAAALGTASADEILERIRESIPEQNFRSLRELDAAQVASLLRGEHPQTIALVLVHLSSREAALVLRAMPEEQRADVTRRMATMGPVAPGAIRAIEMQLEKDVSTIRRSAAAPGGPEFVVEILQHSDRAAGEQILDSISEEDPELADRLRDLLFVFDDIVNVDDRAIRELLKEVQTKELSLALKGAPEPVQAKIFANMSRRAKEVIVEEMDYLGAVRVIDAEQARRSIVMVLRRLADEGQVSLFADENAYVK
jgi:flagellar motor switch protein FliG